MLLRHGNTEAAFLLQAVQTKKVLHTDWLKKANMVYNSNINSFFLQILIFLRFAGKTPNLPPLFKCKSPKKKKKLSSRAISFSCPQFVSEFMFFL